MHPSEPNASKPKQNDPSDPGTTTFRRLQALDNSAWSKLVVEHFDSVYRWCREAGLDEHTSADIAQEVFVSALGSLHRFNRSQSSNFGGWLRRITQRRIADHWRRRSEPAIGGTDAVSMFNQLTCIRNSLEFPSSETPLQDDRLLAAVAAIQPEFQPDTWRAFWMATVENRAAIDIALELGITRNAVYLAKSRITKRLRDYLTNQNSG